jgi:hypothetical protein
VMSYRFTSSVAAWNWLLVMSFMTSSKEAHVGLEIRGDAVASIDTGSGPH